jgi:hypothetical protein
MPGQGTRVNNSASFTNKAACLPAVRKGSPKIMLGYLPTRTILKFCLKVVELIGVRKVINSSTHLLVEVGDDFLVRVA